MMSAGVQAPAPVAMLMLKPRLLCLVATFAVLVSCSATKPECGPSTCTTGCCDFNGVCQPPLGSNCGSSGNACAVCSSNQICSSGRCVSSGSGGGSSGGGGGGAGGGATGGGSCAAACSGRRCGPDGCGGTCGVCPGAGVCQADGTCACTPLSCQSGGIECGLSATGDGCGNALDCGRCATGSCVQSRCDTTGLSCNAASTRSPAAWPAAFPTCRARRANTNPESRTGSPASGSVKGKAATTAKTGTARPRATSRVTVKQARCASSKGGGGCVLRAVPCSTVGVRVGNGAPPFPAPPRARVTRPASLRRARP